MYKCYLLNTGLLMSLAFDNGVLSVPEVYASFTKGKLSVNEGMLFENVVAQPLRSSGRELRYAEPQYGDGDKNVHDIDFIISDGRMILPNEMKSSVSTKHRPLDMFMERYSERVDSAIVIHSKNLRVDGEVLYLPVYMTSLLSVRYLSGVYGQASDIFYIAEELQYL